MTNETPGEYTVYCDGEMVRTRIVNSEERVAFTLDRKTASDVGIAMFFAARTPTSRTEKILIRLAKRIWTARQVDRIAVRD